MCQLFQDNTTNKTLQQVLENGQKYRLLESHFKTL